MADVVLLVIQCSSILRYGTLIICYFFIVVLRQAEQMDLKNNRLKLMNEILAGIKVCRLQ